VYVAFLGVAETGVALTGPGELSVDSLLGYRLSRPWMRNTALAAVAPAAAAVVWRRRQALAAAARADVLAAEPQVPADA
jgi:putative oxidoreductase